MKATNPRLKAVAGRDAQVHPGEVPPGRVCRLPARLEPLLDVVVQPAVGHHGQEPGGVVSRRGRGCRRRSSARPVTVDRLGAPVRHLHHEAHQAPVRRHHPGLAAAPSPSPGAGPSPTSDRAVSTRLASRAGAVAQHRRHGVLVGRRPPRHLPLERAGIASRRPGRPRLGSVQVFSPTASLTASQQVPEDVVRQTHQRRPARRRRSPPPPRSAPGRRPPAPPRPRAAPSPSPGA